MYNILKDQTLKLALKVNKRFCLLQEPLPWQGKPHSGENVTTTTTLLFGVNYISIKIDFQTVLQFCNEIWDKLAVVSLAVNECCWYFPIWQPSLTKLYMKQKIRHEDRGNNSHCCETLFCYSIFFKQRIRYILFSLTLYIFLHNVLDPCFEKKTSISWHTQSLTLFISCC